MAFKGSYSQAASIDQQQPQATSSSLLSPSESSEPILPETPPERVLDYVDLYLIKRATSIGQKNIFTSTSYGYLISIYKATYLNTNQPVCLRRIHNWQQNPNYKNSLFGTIEAWKKINCSNLVRLLQVFITKDFGDNSLILVYQYYPQITSLMQQYFNDPQSGPGGSSNSIYGFSATNRPYSQQIAMLKNRLLPENLIWHYIIQLSSAIRLIHSQGLACRIIDPSKILITSQMPKCPPAHLQPAQYPRIRVSACAMYDIISHDSAIDENGPHLKEYYQNLQQEDLFMFGQLCLVLATSSLSNAPRDRWDQSLELISRTYSGDLKQLIVTLLNVKQNQIVTINDIMPMIGGRFYMQLNLSYDLVDSAQADLEREALNGRLFRLLVKLSMINDRPEFRMDPSWSETGDRYMLKLFREYLFHQVTEDGMPWMDMAHIVSNLLKFDSGSPEKICLISRDEQHVLVVSYYELRNCFENALKELQNL